MSKADEAVLPIPISPSDDGICAFINRFSNEFLPPHQSLLGFLWRQGRLFAALRVPLRTLALIRRGWGGKSEATPVDDSHVDIGSASKGVHASLFREKRRHHRRSDFGR